MEKESNREKVLETLRGALKRDRSRTKTFRVSELGLVEMTRQRVRPSLLHYFSTHCPHCSGTGKILSLPALAMKVERIMKRVSIYCGEKKIELRLNPELGAFFLEEKRERLTAMQREGKTLIHVVKDETLPREEIRVYSGKSGKDLTDLVNY